MKKLLLLLALLFVPALTKAQTNSQFLNVVLGPTGRPLAGATVTFCSDVSEVAIPCTTTIDLFDSTGASISNPTRSDSRGNVNVWAPVGIYLMTVNGNGITPYSIVVNFPGAGGGTVGPGTVNHLAKFTSPTTVGDSTCTDDGTNPTRCPNGMNTAAGGNWAEWEVGVGGVAANKLACRSASNKAVICPAGTTTGVLGVAQATKTVGETALVCFAGKCNVISSTGTTNGHWLIPSTTTDGEVEDTGSTSHPTTGSQTFEAETTVSAGNAVLTTFLSPDTVLGGGGSGDITPCTINGLTYYTAATTLGCITPPVVNGTYFTIYEVTANASVAPVTRLAGVVTRTVSGTTDTILYSDRANKVDYTSSSAVAVTVPQAGSTGFTSNTVFRTKVSGAGVVTFTPTTSTVNGAATFKQTIGQTCTWYSDNTNYTVECGGPSGFSFSIGSPSGSALSTGSTTTEYVTAPFGCKINGYALTLQPSGTITVKFWKVADGSAAPTSGDSINTSGVSISSGTHVASNTVSDFTSTQINYKDVLAMNVTAVATATYVNGVLFCAE